MISARKASRQTLVVFDALTSGAGDWHYGLALARVTGLKSGTLYPILMRLADHGLLESQWEAAGGSGRPPRHLYRLTASGRRVVAEALGADGQGDRAIAGSAGAASCGA